jgi:hypothetical protein
MGDKEQWTKKEFLEILNKTIIHLMSVKELETLAKRVIRELAMRI